MKKKLFAMLLSLVMLLSSVSYLSEVSFAEENDEAVVLNEEEAIDLGEEKTPEAVGEPAALDLSLVHTIAKDKDGNYYAARYYKNGTDTYLRYGGCMYFYKINEVQYNDIANDCFMVFKKKVSNEGEDNTFEIPETYMAKNGFNDFPPLASDIKKLGSIFTELQFINNEAYVETMYMHTSSTPIKIDSQKDFTWSVELKKDWVIERYLNDKTGAYQYYAQVHYNVELNGNNHKIYKEKFSDGNYVVRFGDAMQFNPRKVKAKVWDLTIDGAVKCKPDEKHAVDNDGKFGHYECIEVNPKGELELENVTLMNGYTDQPLHSGGIRLNTDSKLKMSKSKIINCRAVYGGAMHPYKNVNIEIEDSTFVDNSAELGGAICTTKSNNNLNIKNAIFKNNVSKDILGETDVYNRKNIYGGAIYTQSPTEIENSKFTNNSCENTGGAIASTHRDTVVKNSEFKGNKALFGGAIANFNKIELKSSTFDGNIATVDGGAIYTSDKEYKNPVGATKYKYPNIDKNTVFKNNLALAGFFNPPRNYKDFNGNLKFARNSFTDALPDQDVAKSLLNNYDINYRNDNLSAFFHPNGGEFTKGDNPKDIRVVTDKKDAEITLLDAPKWEGHKFIGWKCTRNIPKDILDKLPDEIVKKLSKNTIEALEKEGKVYQAGEKFILDADYIFVAQWGDAPAPKPTEPNTLILTLDENYRGGEITNIEVEEGDLIEPHLYIPRRRGYIFRGWSYDRDHLDEVKPGDRIYTDTTLYTIWKRAEIEKVEEPEEIKGEDHKAYIFGYPNGTVRPNGSITRAEAAAMLARLLNIEAIGSAAKPNFTDTESSWYNKAINAVVFRGIMKGYPDGRFRPNAPITRAEFTQMISTIDNKPYGEAPFADVPGHWAERAIGSEYQAKRITGYPDGLFRPDDNITRAEAAVILNKIFERKYDNLSLLKCKNPQMIKRFTDLDETFWGWNDMVEATNTHEFVRRYKEDVLKRVEEDWLLIKNIKDVK
ncbi:S-layer homology domain-containing protein [Fenollaria timonensis]|uniref:S-layer homology domain-containing protein n=1 Tax=Fenollaria timonensis TaxID=1723384 RepID=UPI0026F17E2C|nr:S-layer homology domain-containing protein [Fenollaria timonensis]